jgi:DNA-binding LytR/AlgR family response regulator
MIAPLRYLIVDDEELGRLSVEAAAKQYPYLLKCGVSSHAIEAREMILSLTPDIVFADIEMPQVNGVDLLRTLVGQVPAPVFITSHPEFAIDGYELDCIDYLLKPFTEKRFARCAQKLHDFFQLRSDALAHINEQEGDTITIKQGYDKFKVRISSILYLEAMKDYTRIVTDAAQYLVLETLTSMNEKLPTGKFIRIHRSFIVNQDKVTGVTLNKVHIKECQLPVGKLYKTIVGDFF